MSESTAAAAEAAGSHCAGKVLERETLLRADWLGV